HQPHRVVDLEDVLAVEDDLLVAAGDGLGAEGDLLRTDGPELESADRILAADEEPLPARNAELGDLLVDLVERDGAVRRVERLEISELGINAERRLAREVEILGDVQRRPDGVDGAAERATGEARAEVEAEPARGVERVVARVEAVRRSDGGGGVL